MQISLHLVALMFVKQKSHLIFSCDICYIHVS